MKNLFICYPRCSTCKKAQKWLDENDISYEYRDIAQQNPTEAELKEWIPRSGLPARKFFNTSGQLYRKLGLKDKLSGLTDAQQIELLATDGMLVKRPLLIGDSGVLVGFKADEWAQLKAEDN